MNLPQSRTRDLIVQELNDELLIYNLSTGRALSLNATSSKVFNACDGQTSFDDFKRNHKFTDDLIYLALDELKRNNLLENYQSTHFGNLSRREVIRRVGLATIVALPVITGIVAPSAASARSVVNFCARENCVDGGPGRGGGCNPPVGCGPLFGGTGVCCASDSGCFCASGGAAGCISVQRGQVCPGVSALNQQF